MSVELNTDSSLRTDFENTINLIKTEYGFLSSENLNNKPFSDDVKRQYADLAQEFLIILNNENIPYFLNSSNAYYRLGYKIDGITITQSLITAIKSVKKSFKDFREADLEHFKKINLRLKQIFYNFQESSRVGEIADEWLTDLKSDVEEKVSNTFEGIERAKIAFENQKITDAYKQTYQQLETDADNLQTKFYWAIGVGSLCAILIIYCKPLQPEGLNYWFLKFLIFALTITLSTYFLRRSVHLRKQSDQLKKEAWEMDALPVFIASLDKAVRDEVIKELVPKYFAKELDQSINDKMADIVNEQIRTSLEVFKTGTEIVKSLKPSAAKEEDADKKE